MSIAYRFGGLLGASFLVGMTLIACSGASDNDVFGSGTSGSSGSGTSGSSGSGTSGGSSSGSTGDGGVVCGPCQQPAPAPGCVGKGPCGCEPYQCPSDETCEWTKNGDSCGAGRYCKTSNCGRGVCAPIAVTEEPTRAPVCGCDGVTYWNASVAAKSGMSVKGDAECGNGGNTVTCGGLASLPCPKDTVCNYLVKKDECSTTEHAGTCWGLPAICPIPAVGFGPRYRACATTTCAEECPLIRRQMPWYTNGALCPL